LSFKTWEIRFDKRQVSFLVVKPVECKLFITFGLLGLFLGLQIKFELGAGLGLRFSGSGLKSRLV